MKACVQRNTKHQMNRESAKHGLYLVGSVVDELEYSEIKDVKDYDIFYGNVNFIWKVLNDLQYNIRSIGHVPEDLIPFAGREICRMPLSDALELKKTKPIFIKPIPENNKKFTGMTFDSPYAMYELNGYGNDDVLVSPVINIVSEWRGFVCKDELVGSRNYKGDFRISPDYSKIEPFLTQWKDRPSAWSCDFGITDKGETIIVECNDVMCLGWYGLDPINVGNILDTRWTEIHKNKST